jgi:hypothetical protein
MKSSRAQFVAQVLAYMKSADCSQVTTGGDRRACRESLRKLPAAVLKLSSGSGDSGPDAYRYGAAVYAECFLLLTASRLPKRLRNLPATLRRHLRRWMAFDEKLIDAWEECTSIGQTARQLGTDPDYVCYRWALLRDRGLDLPPFRGK